MVMPSRMTGPSRAAWLLPALMMTAGAQSLSQSYCSNDNTGADFQGGT